MQRAWTPHSKHEWGGLENTVQTLQDPRSSFFLFLFFVFIFFFSCDLITAHWKSASCAVIRPADQKELRDCGRKGTWQRDFLSTELWMAKWGERKRKSGTTLHLSSTSHRSLLSSALSLYLSPTPPELSGIAPSKYGPDEGAVGAPQIAWLIISVCKSHESL